MNKFFDIIHLNGYMYAVDKSLRIFVQNDWIIEKDLYVNKFPSYMTDLNECSIIIATTDPSLGLPLLPDIEKLPSFIEVMGFDDNLHADNEDYAQYRMYIEGYKAATAKKYTEEDLRKAHFHGWFQRERYDSPDKTGYEGKYPKEWNEMDYEEREKWFENQFIQSLNPKPKRVWLELENDVPLMKNGYVIVNKWEF